MSNKKIRLDLRRFTREYSDPLYILANFKHQARKEEWTEQEITETIINALMADTFHFNKVMLLSCDWPDD